VRDYVIRGETEATLKYSEITRVIGATHAYLLPNLWRFLRPTPCPPIIHRSYEENIPSLFFSRRKLAIFSTSLVAHFDRRGTIRRWASCKSDCDTCLPLVLFFEFRRAPSQELSRPMFVILSPSRGNIDVREREREREGKREFAISLTVAFE